MAEPGNQTQLMDRPLLQGKAVKYKTPPVHAGGPRSLTCYSSVAPAEEFPLQLSSSTVVIPCLLRYFSVLLR